MIEEIGRQLVLVIMVLGITFAGPAVAIWLLQRRKRAARAARRSPLTEQLLRGPGQALREKLEDLRIDFAFDVSILMVIPTALLSIYLLQLQIRALPPSAWVHVFVGLFCAGLVAQLIRTLLSKSAELDKLRKGLDAEIAVGQELDQLMRQGAAVFHDFQAEKFNIDHVVIAPQGVFCVETKGYTKPAGVDGSVAAKVLFDGKTLQFPDWQTAKPLEQAERNAKWLEKWLAKATAVPLTVTPVLALPGWYVDRRGRGNVRVFSGKELPSLLKAGTANSLSPDQMQRAVHQVEQHCRDVKPRYREED